MGWIVHHAIIVTAHGDSDITRAREEARRLFQGYVSDVIESPINGYWSFLIPPDGSKEGWPESDAGDAQRAQFHAWIAAQAYEDGSNSFDVVEVAYGEVQQPVVTMSNGQATGARLKGC